MSDIQIWYTDGNDMIFELSGVKNQLDGSFVNDATVSITLKDDQGVDVPGISWPVAVPFTGTDGLYRAIIDKAAQVLDDQGYELTVIAVNPGGIDAEWRVPVGGETRS